MDTSKDIKKIYNSQGLTESHQTSIDDFPFLKNLTLVLSFAVFIVAVGMLALTILIFHKLDNYLGSDLITFTIFSIAQIVICIFLQIVFVKLDNAITKYFLARKFFWKALIVYWRNFLNKNFCRINKDEEQNDRTKIRKNKIFRLKPGKSTRPIKKVPIKPQNSSGYLLNYATMEVKEKIKDY